jgi:Domain of unknown function (DUF4124)
MLHQRHLLKIVHRTLCVMTCCLSMHTPTVLGTSIYRYEDEAGRTVYTNVPPKGKEVKDKKMRLVTEPISIIPNRVGRLGIILPSPDRATHSHSEFSESRSTDSLEGVPSRVDTNTQQGRDATRRSILLNELSSEKQALTEAQKQRESTPLISPESVKGPGLKLPGLNTLQQTIESHERNIQALQKELGQK